MFSGELKARGPKVQTSHGIVCGRRLITDDDKEYVSYLGIPYARPPLGELRFKKPEPPVPWTFLEADSYRSRPIQKNYVWDQYETKVSISEDCLHLNIVTPAQSSKRFPNGYPVIFYVHGGGYVMDSAAKYNHCKLAKLLVSKHVIVVTVEYRVGLLGFLCLDDKLAKGNYGVWDVIEGLKFFKHNARAFGADPDNITLGGQSAGSCIVDLLSLSPLSRDLFKQKILMAGFAENSWAVSNKQSVIDFCRKKAVKLGFQRFSQTHEWTADENAECIKFLKQVDSYKFGMSMIGEKSIINEMRLALTPVLDDELFPQPIQELRNESPPKTTIAGITQFEGLLFLPLGRRKPNTRFLRFCERKVEEAVNEYSALSEAQKKATILNFREAYNIKSKYISRRNAHEAGIKIVSDLINGIGLYKHCLNNLQAGGTCYSYMFEYYNWTLTAPFNIIIPFSGSTHGSEIPFIFGVNIFLTPFIKRHRDREVSDIVTRLWTNFAKYGNPNGDELEASKQFSFTWEPITLENPRQYLCINRTTKLKNDTHNRLEKLVPVLDAFYAKLSASDNKKSDSQ